jgi:hypothetical protein
MATGLAIKERYAMPTGSYTDPLQSSNPASSGKSSSDVRNITNEAKQAAQEHAGAVWNSTKDSARSLIGEQQRAAAGGIGDFAQALRKVAQEMGGGQQSSTSRLVQSAADGLERFSGSLKDRDLNGLVGEVESFARRQPVAFFGAAVAAGFLAVRFLKSSNQTQQTQPAARDFTSGTAARDFTPGTPY